MLETLDYTIRIGSTPTILYDLYRQMHREFDPPIGEWMIHVYHPKE